MLSLRAPPRTLSASPWRRRGRLDGFAAPRCVSAAPPATTLETATARPAGVSFPILVNGCTGKMGVSVAEAATSRGLHLVPVSFSSRENLDKTIQVGDTDVEIYGPSAREDVLSSVIDEYPDVVVVDYTAPDSVNSNAELYCKLGVPFVMGTTGGDQQLLYKSVQDSENYALISPQMGKQVVAFLAAMETIAEQFPGAFSGYRLEVLESHQAGKLDTSGTAKAVIACFEKLGAVFDMERQMVKIRDPEQQLYMVGVPEEHIEGHAFHLYHLTSPDDSVSFEFQHNVCGRSIYAEGSVDAAVFLYKKVQSMDPKRIYNMIDVLQEGDMR
ncbi:probable 4-hydroxy-tetrahydrodipicolinate reductase 2, chloroplastic isoform X1 [Triticum dicoccoides]|uniref:probable 4-hydroxy-tetrahydrodipicolinate reductase 2, chloroplastic isoform X1 n=1 Tax=Triticum dicoccoides TaxID=85692 RepID=UPI00188FD42F|nr:probable 4-hydroxy-tetrahydrodipicolinate reductase 2, chloroplastic isoform X1 [Triticum dicoccoides]